MARNEIAKGWEDPKTFEDMMEEEGDSGSNNITIAPEEPVSIYRNPETNQVEQVTYGDMKRMMEGNPTVMWSETILRNEEGQVIGVQTMRPNGTNTIEHIKRDENGKFSGTELEYL